MAKWVRMGRGLAAFFSIVLGLSAQAEDLAELQSADRENVVLAEGEKPLSGEPSSAYVALYERFVQANTTEEHLQQIGVLAQTALVEGKLSGLLRAFGDDRWGSTLLRAAIFQYLDDLPAALDEIRKNDVDEVPERYRLPSAEQQMVWARETGDLELFLSSARSIYRKNPTEESHANYLFALFESDSEEELLQHLEERNDRLEVEADFWRSRLPEFHERNWLEKAAEIFVPAWENGPAEARFAYGELLLFLNEDDVARSVFWTLFKETEGANGENAYRRLNHFFHNRFAVKNRIARVTGGYGSEASRDFAFFGLRDDLTVFDGTSARDGALNYLRELELNRGSSREFLLRLREALDVRPQSAGERILAFAQVGAPGWMLEEIEDFLRGGDFDPTGAELALISINRLILSTERFPEYREPMRDLAAKLEERSKGQVSQAVEERIRELRERIFRRLGIADLREEEPGENLYVRLANAVENGKPAEAEKIYQELEEKGEGSSGALLWLARAWMNDGQPIEAAARVADFLRGFYRVNREVVLQTPLAWTDAELALSNPWHNEQQQEMLTHAFEILSGSVEAQAELEKIWEEEWSRLSVSEQIGAGLIRVHFFRWANEPDQMLETARQGLEVPDQEWQLFCAWMLGIGGEFDEAAEALESIIFAKNATRVRAHRLLFALAVAGGMKAVALEQAEVLEEEKLQSGERVTIAAGLNAFGESEQALAWLEPVDPTEISGRFREPYQRVLLEIYAESEPDRSIAMAHSILLSEFPESIYHLGNGLRSGALAVLKRTERLEEYERELNTLAEEASHSISLHLLLGESAEFRGDLSLARNIFLGIVPSIGGDADLRLELTEWLGQNGFLQEAIAQYKQILDRHSTSALLVLTTLLRAFQDGGELAYLVELLADWEAPDAKSLDEFYGLQPTAHIF